MRTLLLSRLFLGALLAVLLLAAPAHAARPFAVGSGGAPEIAVDARGTAHIVWNPKRGAVFQGDPDAVEYCQVPHRGRACARRLVLDLPPDGATNVVDVFAPAPGVVLIVSHGIVTSHVDPTPVLLFRSTDGGATFAGPSRIGTTFGGSAYADAVLDRQSVLMVRAGQLLWDEQRAVEFQRQPIDGSPPPSTSAWINRGYGGNTAAVGVAGSQVVVASDGARADHTLETVVSHWRGTGDPHDAATWAPPRKVARSYGGRLAGGPRGLFLMLSAYRRRGYPDGYVAIYRWRGNRFVSVRRLRGASWHISHSQDLFQASSGRLAAVWWGGRRPSKGLRYTRSRTGRRWSRPRTIVRASYIFNLEVATAPNGRGFAVYSHKLNSPYEMRVVPVGP